MTNDEKYKRALEALLMIAGMYSIPPSPNSCEKQDNGELVLRAMRAGRSTVAVVAMEALKDIGVTLE